MSLTTAGLERAAVAMLRTLGGGRAELLVAQAAETGASAGLGLATPMAMAVALEPVLLQATVSGQSLLALMTRQTVETALRDAGSVGEVVDVVKASMLRAGVTQYRIAAVTVKRFGGEELLYELEIEA